MNAAVYSVRLTGRATRFLQLLQDYGHLDDQGFDQVLLGLAEIVGTQEGALVDLPMVRRMAAATLFGPDAEDPEGVLTQDWPFLFS